MQQLKLWQQREKEWARTRAKREMSNKRNIYFNDSVMLLEAAARNDIDEGELQMCLLDVYMTYHAALRSSWNSLFC